MLGSYKELYNAREGSKRLSHTVVDLESKLRGEKSEKHAAFRDNTALANEVCMIDPTFHALFGCFSKEALFVIAAV